MNEIKTAFILAAGRGTRLRPLTESCPKPLLPMAGRPIITHVMDHLIAAGIRRFIVNTHHLPQAYHEAFPAGHWRGRPVIFRFEPVLLDSAGGLKNIEDLLDADDETVIACNGDILSDMPIAPLFEEHFKSGAEVTLALRSEGYLKNVGIDETGAVRDIRHIIGSPGLRNCQFASVYAVDRRFFARLKPGKIESVVDVFIRMIKQGRQAIKGVVIDEGFWEGVNDVETYHRLNEHMKEKEGTATRK